MTVTRVVGIDLSLTKTGVCVVTPDGLDGRRKYPDSVSSEGHVDDDLLTRHWRLNDLRVGVLRLAGEPGPDTLVVIELPAYSKSQGSNTDRLGLWWSVVARCFDAGALLAAVPATTLKKWATGRGGADKAAVASAMTRVCPSVQLANSDEADATALALMGAQHLGWRPDLDTKYRSEAIAAATWPTLEEI